MFNSRPQANQTRSHKELLLVIWHNAQATTEQLQCQQAHPISFNFLRKKKNQEAQGENSNNKGLARFPQHRKPLPPKTLHHLRIFDFPNKQLLLKGKKY